MPREWDAQTYDAIPMPHVRWGARTLDLLDLTGGDRVLDAGCGTGRVTEQLLQKLPRGRVVALDGARAMLDQLRVRLSPMLNRVDPLRADLTQPLPEIDPVDGVFSTATFHWIPDHQALFRHLAAVLRPGGWLVAECGGAGNVAGINAVLEDLGYDQAQIWNFAGPEETRDRLQSAGFTDIHTWLTPDPVPFPPGQPLETYLATVVLGAQLDTMPKERRPEFVREVACRLPRPEVDYVRLTMTARWLH